MALPDDLYFIALLPPASMRAKVRAIQKEIQQRFSSEHALKSPPHITLQMPFRLPAESLEILKQTLDGFARSREAFSVELQDFDCFEPGVIFIKLKEHGPTRELEDKLQAALYHSQLPNARNPGRPFHPHMTIASRDLRKSEFYRAWAEFKARRLYMEFEVLGLYLLRHNGQQWDIFMEFPF